MAPPKSLVHSQRLKRCGEWMMRPDLVVVGAEDDVEAEAAGEAEDVEVVVGGVITVGVVAKVTWRGRPRGRGGRRGGEGAEEWNGLRR
jgi:hypothetical protein